MKRSLTIAILLLVAATGFAQSGRTTDFGGIASAELEVGLPSRFALTVEEELRFYQNCTQFNRWLTSVGVEHSLMANRMKVGLNADYIRRHNDEGYYENRWRTGLYVTYSETFRHFKFGIRSKLLFTFYDERTGEHRVNPKLYWRNRLQASYQQPNSRFKYSLSAELFWLTNDPKGRIVDNLRTVASVEYRLTRRHYLSLFARMDNDLQVKEPVDRFWLGLTFEGKY
ncbi:MAG: DUF2490 domain-containing protein [Bacteroidales bacterium]|nr:DUF2490 domain-containing protein [Bacteroidales bacterium]